MKRRFYLQSHSGRGACSDELVRAHSRRRLYLRSLLPGKKITMEVKI
jgi:hypothetical protein